MSDHGARDSSGAATAGAARLSPLKSALLAVKRMRAELEHAERARAEPIAVIGIGCRFPGGATDAESLWRVFRYGVDAISEVPPDRWDVDAWYDPDPATRGRIATRCGGFVDDVDRFDADFFGVTPREATGIDPQQRLLLEVTWEALEHAGQPRERFAGSRTGVFMGACTTDYQWCQGRDPVHIDPYTGIGNAHSVLAGRVSYLLDLHGPCVAVDTACSSSLVAVHLACQSLRNDECSMALAGGVNLILSPVASLALSRLGALAPDGRCKPFDARANGYVRSEGCGVVVLKRLSDAVAQGDPILALVRGSATNQDGRTSGLIAPNGLSQQALMRDALRNAHVPAAAVGCIEAHGTGTALGDPIEFEALAAVYGAPRPQGPPCALGSAKANLGHLEAAAGVAGLIKAVLSLQREEIPPLLHFESLNPNISLDGTPFVVPTTPLPWPANGTPRYACVSSFGWSGTNAHVVLEGVVAPSDAARAERTDGDTLYALPLSARSERALDALAGAYAERLAALEPGDDLRDIVYTAAVRRTHHTHRLCAVGRTAAELARRLEAFRRREDDADVAAGQCRPGRQPRVVYVFSGQGSQWVGMGAELRREERVFREALERCEAAMRRHVDWSLAAELAAGARLGRDEVDVVQPAIFALQVALAALWQAWGLEPAAVVGHSLGEVAAAHVAGALTLEDAARVICERSRIVKAASGRGGMMVVELSFAAAQAALQGYEARVAVAAANGPTSAILSGAPDALAALQATLEAREVFCRLVKVDYASHSPQMDGLRAPLRAALRDLRPLRATVPMVSTVTGRVEDGTGFDAAYWARNLREPVRFWDAIAGLAGSGHGVFVEVSPHPVLTAGIEAGLAAEGRRAVVVGSLRRGKPERASLLGTVGALYAAGHPIAWRPLHPAGGRCVALPAYPWQRERYWVASPGDGLRAPAPPGDARLGAAVAPATAPGTHVWELPLGTDAFPYLADHRLDGAIVLPGAFYADVALQAGRQLLGDGPIEVADLTFERPLVVPEDGGRTLQVVASAADGALALAFYSRPADAAAARAPWTPHAAATVRRAAADAPSTVALEAIGARCTETLTADEHYASLASRGLEAGPAFQGIVELRRRDGEALARLAPAHAADLGAGHAIHPAALDACLQAVAAAIPGASAAGPAYLAIGASAVQVHGDVRSARWGHAVVADPTVDADAYEADVDGLDDGGTPVVVVRGLRIRRIGAGRTPRHDVDRCFYELAWEPVPRAADATSVPPGGRWLVFADAGGVGEALREALVARGDHVLLAFAGDTFTRIDDARLRLRLDHPDDLARTLDTAGDCRGVVHLWSLDTPPAGPTLDGLCAAATRGCLHAARLLQALAARPAAEPPHLWLVTRGAQAVAASDPTPAVAQAPLWGFGRTVAQEHPALWGGLVDLDPAATVADAATALRDAITRPDAEDQVALRDGVRHGPRLVRAGRAPVGPAFRWRPDATYVISGGLGGLGLAVAGWMVEQGARRLILASRTPLPPRARWSTLAADDPRAERVAAVRALEARGASVHLAAVDVTDPARLGAFLDAFRREGWPPIRGVVHAATVVHRQPTLELDAETMWEDLAPKVLGGWLLHDLLADAPLDFFVLFSSISGILSSPMMAGYAAGNAFLDALAHHRRAAGRPAVSIDWGTWSGVGLAAAAKEAGALALRGMVDLTPAQGLEALGRILQEDRAQVIVMESDWPEWCRAHPTAAAAALLARVVREEPARRTAAPLTRESLLAVPPAARHALLQSRLRERIATVLERDPAVLDVDQPLLDVGIDSLMAIELKNEIEHALRVVVPVVRFLEGPSIAQLAAQVLALVDGGAAPPPALAIEPVRRTGTDVDELTGALDRLSDDEVERLLAAESRRSHATE